jgi:response regulator RpfG family c-di-GMP phosphodiesterase
MERTHHERFAGTRCPKQLLGDPVILAASDLMDNAIRDP